MPARLGWVLGSTLLVGCLAHRSGKTPSAGAEAPGAASSAGATAPTPPLPAAPPPGPAAPAPPSEPPVTASGPPWLGLQLAARIPSLPGVDVRSVISGSPAERAGLQPQDILLSLEGVSLTSPDQVISAVREHRVGESLAIGFERGGEKRLVRVDLTARPSNGDIVRGELIGRLAPELGVFEDIQGAPKHTLQSLRGKVVVLEFWAPWCGVCRFMVPTMNTWHRDLRAQGLEIIGITASSVEESTRTAFQLGMKYPLAADESGEITKVYKAMSIPMVVVIDQRGTVKDVLVGYSPERLTEMRALIEKLLRER